MNKFFGAVAAAFCGLALCGCTQGDKKAANISWAYLAIAILSVVLFLCCLFLIKNRSKWVRLLFGSVMVVNIGYYFLSVSHTVTQALFWNSFSYLGSVFLPFSILIIIFKITRVDHKRWIYIALGTLALGVFVIASSPFYCDIYYKSVSIDTVGGITMLNKDYGPLHIVYLFYLLGYFAAMVTAVVRATVKHKIESRTYALVLSFAVFINIAVWGMEQLVSIPFELLSVSYIISEVFLLGLFLIIQQNAVNAAQGTALPAQGAVAAEGKAAELPCKEQLAVFENGVKQLTQTEKIIYGYYLQGKSTKEIMSLLGITENTLKFHNKNIYGKLGVTSRKRLVELAGYLQSTT